MFKGVMFDLCKPSQICLMPFSVNLTETSYLVVSKVKHTDLCILCKEYIMAKRCCGYGNGIITPM